MFRRRIYRPAGVAIALALACAWPHAHAAKGKGATRAEVQIGLCAPQADLERALGLRSSEPPYEVWQFDDASLALLDRGLRLRLRVQSAQSVLTLKVANQKCEDIAPDLVPAREGKCEYDVYGAQQAGAVSLNKVLDASTARDLVAGRLPVAQALSAAQVRYLRDGVAYWPLPPDLKILGPIQALTYRTKGKAYDVDVNVMPGGERYAEITRKVPVADAERAFTALKDYVAAAGIAECSERSGQAANKLRALLPGR
jgi:hypothetical protein